MMNHRVIRSSVMVLLNAIAMGSVAAHAQGAGGDCLAFTDKLTVPILVILESTSRESPNATMTIFQEHEMGFSESPWIVQPGGIQVLVVPMPDNSLEYVTSASGFFTVNVTPIQPSPEQGMAVQISSWVHPPVAWQFHPEMNESGHCNGAWVGTVGS